MAIAFPTISRGVDLDATREKTYRIKEAGFGDGYTQRTADGINGSKEVWSVNFKRINRADFDTLDDFMDARGGYEAILWTPPGDLDEKKYTVKVTSRTDHGLGQYSISFRFEQVYDIT